MESIGYNISEQHVVEHAKAHRKTYRWTYIRPYLAATVCLIGIVYVNNPALTSLVIPAILVGLYLFFANYIYERRLTKQLRKVILGTFLMEIDAEKISMKTKDGRSEIKISSILTAHEMENYYLLYLNRISFLGVPKSAFDSDDKRNSFLNLFPNCSRSRKIGRNFPEITQHLRY